MSDEKQQQTSHGLLDATDVLTWPDAATLARLNYRKPIDEVCAELAAFDAVRKRIIARYENRAAE